MTHTAEGSAARTDDGPVARVLARTIHPGTTTHGGTEEEYAWLVARQGRITATMAKELVRGGQAARRRVLDASFEPPAPIIGNRYIDRGHDREPVIAAWIQRRFGIEPNTALIAAEQNDRHASTPDGIGAEWMPAGAGDLLVLAEIKTSKHDLDPRLPYFERTGYWDQMQWQMHTTGASRTLFVWEQHDDAWPNPQPLDLEPRYAWIDRDDAHIGRMVAAADLALAERDRIVAERAEQGIVENADPELEALALAVLDARIEAKAAEERKQAPWNRMLGLLAHREGFALRTGLAQIAWTNEVVETQVPDPDAAAAAEIEFATGVIIHGADLAEHVLECEKALAATEEAAALALARETWEKHLAGYTKTIRKSKQRLDVNPPKREKEQDR